jgi:glycine dehydrogenase
MSTSFVDRHIATDIIDQVTMLELIGYSTLDGLINKAIPGKIRRIKPMPLPKALSEHDALKSLKKIAAKNKVYKTYIGQGYHYSHTPKVILRNIFENPAWYTAYTPYQPEISQGRLEALLNFQQMVIDLTGMDVSNASMLDESTAAAEAMTLVMRSNPNNTSKTFFVDQHVLPQTIEVIQTRAAPLGINVVVGHYNDVFNEQNSDNTEFEFPFAVLLQYPNVIGEVNDYFTYTDKLHTQDCKVIVAADLLSLTVFSPPGEWGADVVVGNTQRFGVPVGFGGPHAAFLATKDAYKRSMPGRLVGVSIDAYGNQAYRLTLQTREQHIRREKATSNICTAQALLAIMASMYAVYHGPEGLKNIASSVLVKSSSLRCLLEQLDITIINASHFDTLTLYFADADMVNKIHERAYANEINFRIIDAHHLGITLDETTDMQDTAIIFAVIAKALNKTLSKEQSIDIIQQQGLKSAINKSLIRTSSYLTQDVFNRHHSEHEMLRYIRFLSDKDLALDRTMIPLGSCTMKLNATSEMIPVSWSEFSDIHPYAPESQTLGYIEMIEQLEDMLCACTGYAGVSLQPNAGSQGEYAGLLIIQKYHASRGQSNRNICLIPSSAHGTNPASANMVGMQVVVVKCDDNGNVDLVDLNNKAIEHSNNLAAIMVTYPSTHGVFEEGITDIARIVHEHGGQVYIDGANMNALVGTASPGHFGGDVSHLNLHKTFCIPHGGGGPGVGPVAVAEHLVPFLPHHKSNSYVRNINATDKTSTGIGAVSGTAYGSASILPISWMYIVMMGNRGLTNATKIAILHANYIAKMLENCYPILYTGNNGLIAHECILDIRQIQKETGISNEDIAKRLIDFGFHAPTMSFPVAGTLMIEPTESESKVEIDRFINAMICIYFEIESIRDGTWTQEDNPLKHAPHTAQSLLKNEWNHTYTRERAAYPLEYLKKRKYWSPVSRVDNVYGDRNLCTCIPIEAYAKQD